MRCTPRHSNARLASAPERQDPRRRGDTACMEILAHLGRMTGDATGTVAAVVVLMVVMAYWILKT
jgi:hypothetical protein